ncbi:minor capsid protein [Streptomyces sp. OfavH-34-F]|uniref:minor capsid protein n=1 Tax=Streptomyces sp. OfavH-34-F TaxID=2917760 RepID=UPI001EF2CA06|nr:minor capsid protein [Streptomyces sp. OfavH-34-F]MCG7524940.1 minor capsid protein [Streptomyces sp. OfavH-34-F]
MRSTRQGAARGLRLGTEYGLERANRRVPIEEATLERSGTATVDEAALKGAIAYDTPYAVRQHEELDYQHDAGREAKWLERTLTEESEAIGEIIATQVRRSLRD